MGPGYEPRQQQLTMAQAVADTLSTKTRLLVEAGTGVGKSFAYLVPAALRAMTAPAGERVVIATNTIALQEQLIARDIPLLIETLGTAGAGWGLDPSTTRALVPALCKGRGNYVSIRRLKLTSQRQDRLLADAAQRRSLHVIEDWAYETQDGTLSSLPALERPGVWERVQSDSDNCMGRKCPTYEQCFYQRSRQAMESANLLVCNHALFFADLSLRRAGAGFLPPYDHVILDEAHAVEDVASDHFGLTLSEGRVEHLCAALYHAGSGKGFLPQLGSSSAADVSQAVDAAAAAVVEVQEVSRAFFSEALALLRSGAGGGSGGGGGGRLSGPGMLTAPLPAALTALGLRLRMLRERAPAEADKLELNAYATRAEAMAFDADGLVNQKVPASVYWIEGAGGPADDSGRARGSAPRLKLACSPIEVGPLLREHLFGRPVSVVLTSATLAIDPPKAKPKPRTKPAGPATDSVTDTSAPPAPDTSAPAAAPPDAFTHVRLRLGCEDAVGLQLGSPFDHAKQAKVIVDLVAGDPRRAKFAAGSTPTPQSTGNFIAGANWVRVLADRVLFHLDATCGGAFVLFTSFDSLRRVGDLLHEPLAERGWPLLAQGRDGTPGQVLERFRRDERSVLLGAASFWQGVDVKGRGLRNVIITKLPFDPPDRPIVEARAERIRERGGDPFAEDSLPRAILRFKQGFGRLIRSQTDTGQVVVLDPRVVAAGYGRRFLAALPEGVPIEVIEPAPLPQPGPGGAAVAAHKPEIDHEVGGRGA